MNSPIITTFVLGDYQTNCFVVQPHADAESCWIVDCGFEPESLLEYVAGHGLEPVALLLTHCHSDHIAGVDKAIARFGGSSSGGKGHMPIYVHESEAGFCSDPGLNLSAFIGQPFTVTEPDHKLHDGDVLHLGETSWRVLHSPGHSPGGVLFVHDESKQAIVGDTIFAGSIGRHDFPTSNVDDLRRSLHEVVMSLPDDMTIYPGHGPATTVGVERRTNPFLVRGF